MNKIKLFPSIFIINREKTQQPLVGLYTNKAAY